MKMKIIKTEVEYEQGLRRIEALMDAEPGSPEEDELDLLSLLVEKYEDAHYPIDYPDPVEAIKFRMEQEGLAPKDLIQYLGSQSKVSEVLNRKRPLSLSMVRALNQGLGIPADVLIQSPSDRPTDMNFIEARKPSQEAFYYNCSHLLNENQQTNLWNWQSDVIKKANKQNIPPFNRNNVDNSLFQELFRLGAYSSGPQMARELLNRKGVHLVVQKTSFESDLDGAVVFTPQNHPVISLTLRNNRLDEFWFTLFHLLAHLYLRQGEKSVAYFESIDCVFEKTAPDEERKVNQLLREILIPSNAWRTSLQAYIENRDQATLNQAIRIFDTTPEIFSCLVRVENEGEGGMTTQKQVSETFEIYS